MRKLFSNIGDRSNQSALGIWWWQIDRKLLAVFASLLFLSGILVIASSPPVAKRIGYSPFHFVTKQYVFLFLSLLFMIFISCLEKNKIRKIAILGLIGSLLIMLFLPFVGADAKGAKRWLNLGGITLQPSEFMKPCFIIIVAWILSEGARLKDFPSFKISIGLFVLTAGLLMLQPDIGMTMTLSAIFGAQIFIAGLPLIWVFVLGGFAASILLGAYVMFPHVAQRINGFLDPASVDNYQVEKSLEAFTSGGVWGRGLGEGVTKWSLPDAHTDFIYAVIAEEFGLFFTFLAIILYGFIIVRGLKQAMQANDLFVKIALAGLTIQLGLQAFINMGVAVHLLPAKGMTLPFLSYGGSSMLAIAFTAGAILALSKRQYGSLKVGANNLQFNDF
jgi:cell division protein FtsW